MNSEKAQSLVIKEVQQLESALEAEIDSRKRMKRTTRIITLLLCFVFLMFLGVNVIHFSTSWTEEKFKKSIAEEMGELSPVAMQELTAMAKALTPVYAEEGQLQLTKMMPELSETFEKELKLLGTELVNEIHERMRTSMGRMSERTEERLYEEFPDLKERENQEELVRRFQEVTDETVTSALMGFQNRFRGDVDESIDVLLAFDVSDGEEGSLELRKKFLMLWLKLLEIEVMEL